MLDCNFLEPSPVVMTVPGGFAASSQFIVVSDAAWDRISPEDQEVINALSGEAMVSKFATVWQAHNAKAIDELMAGGLTRIELAGADLDEMKERLAPIWDQWIEAANAQGVDANAAVDFYQEQLDEVAEELGVDRN